MGPIRVRMPRNGEMFGQIIELLGASRFKIDCRDNVERVCRIPGKFRRRLKVKPGDWVLIKPWSIEDEKGDIAWIYTNTQANWLRRKGII